MFRIDSEVTPTTAKTPTLGTWELDLLRTVERVVRLGHIVTDHPRQTSEPARVRRSRGRKGLAG
jgi:hypothetical protein